MAEERGAQIIPVAETPTAPRTPIYLRFFSLLRTNPNFRRLWLAQLVSEIGDWFYSLAVYDLLYQMTHSGRMVSYAVIMQTLPWFFMTPLAGALVDRFSRRRLMILSDIVQGIAVLGLLFVRQPSQVWLVYLFLGIEVLFASIFEPARSALLPNLTETENLLAANALSSATWSFSLMMGAALGGVVTALLGRPVAFVLNSISYFASALLVTRIVCRETHLDARPGEPSGARSKFEVLVEGATYLKQNPKVTALILGKTGIGILGGGLSLLVVFGEKLFPIAGHGALAMGLLYASRGVGAGIGPIVGDHLMRDRESRMWRGISVSFLLMGCAYIGLSRAPNLLLAMLALMLAHMGGSNVWVTTTTLLQMHTTDRIRGRVFALDAGMIMLAISSSNFVIGMGLDTWNFTARQWAAGMGVTLLIPCLLWLPVQAAWGETKVEGSRLKDEG
jgi:MFS family permease